MITFDFRFIQKTQSLQRATLTATRRWLNRVGGFTRKVARRSLKRAKRHRTETTLTDEQLDRWVAWNQIRERQGLEVPAPYPEKTSKPGRPPLLHSSDSPLKRLLVYSADAERGDVVIGPERAKTGIAHKLEHGSGRIKPRPFMGPAAEKAEPRMAGWWADAIK